MGVIDDQLRMATARAHTDVELIHVSRRDFDQKLDQTDVIVRGVMAVLSDRLRQLQQTKNKS
jgi:CRP-like cAMP-binding protein